MKPEFALKINTLGNLIRVCAQWVSIAATQGVKKTTNRSMINRLEMGA